MFTHKQYKELEFTYDKDVFTSSIPVKTLKVKDELLWQPIGGVYNKVAIFEIGVEWIFCLLDEDKKEILCYRASDVYSTNTQSVMNGNPKELDGTIKESYARFSDEFDKKLPELHTPMGVRILSQADVSLVRQDIKKHLQYLMT